MLLWNNEWSPPSSGLSEQSIPLALRDRVTRDNVDARMITEIDGVTYEIVGISLEGVNAHYFEFFNLSDDNETLSNVALAAPCGDDHDRTRRARRRARRPAGGAPGGRRLRSRQGDRRRPAGDTPRSRPTIPISGCSPARSTTWPRRCSNGSSATPVSPPTSARAALASDDAVGLDRRDGGAARRDAGRAQAALDLLVSDVARFRGLVEDLLEISRFDAGAIRLHLEDPRVSQFVRNAVAVSSAPSVEVRDVAAGGERDHQRRSPPLGAGGRQPHRQRLAYGAGHPR